MEAFSTYENQLQGQLDTYQKYPSGTMMNSLNIFLRQIDTNYLLNTLNLVQVQ